MPRKRPIAPPGYEPLWPKDGKFNYVEDSVNFDGKQTKKKVSSDIEYVTLAIPPHHP